jgi:hypothetical protein
MSDNDTIKAEDWAAAERRRIELLRHPEPEPESDEHDLTLCGQRSE